MRHYHYKTFKWYNYIFFKGNVQCNRFIVNYDKDVSFDPEDLVVEEMHKSHGIYEYVGTRRDSANPNEKGPVFLPTPFIKEEACLIHNWGDGHGWKGSVILYYSLFIKIDGINQFLKC